MTRINYENVGYFHSIGPMHFSSLAKASAVVVCVEESGKKQISVHVDMRNWLVIRDGDLKDVARIVGDDRGFFVAQRVWGSDNTTFSDVYTYEPKSLRLNKKTLWLVKRNNDSDEFDNIVENYNYDCKLE